MNVRRYSITTSRRWLMPRQRIETMPTLGFDFDSRMSRISLSAQSVSPTKTGFGSLMSVQARFAAAFSLVSGTVMPVISASVKVLLTRIWPNCVRSACGASKWIWFVFSVRQVNRMLSVLGDRAAEAAAEDVADVEVLVEAALARPSAPLACSVAMRASFRVGQDPAAPARRPAGRSSRRRARTAPRPSCSPRSAASSTRCAHATDSASLGANTRLTIVDLRRVDAGLAAEAERPREAGGPPRARRRRGRRGGRRRRGRGCRPRPSRRRPSSGRTGSPDRPARGSEPSSAPRSTAPSRSAATRGLRRGLVGERAGPGPSRRSRSPAGPRRRARRPRRASPSAGRAPPARSSRASGEVVLEPARARAVDPDDRRARAGATSSRASSLRSGVTASSRSATTASASDASALRSLRLVGAGREEQRAESCEHSRGPLYVRHSAGTVKRRSAGCSLDSRPEVRHKRPLLDRPTWRSSVKAVVFHEFGGLGRAAARGGRRPAARPGRGR